MRSCNSRFLVRFVVMAGLVLGQAFTSTATPAAAGSGCQLDQIAFCDTFDAPSPNGAGTRSGDLDGVVWGVSRTTSEDNPSQGRYYHWNASHLNKCGSVQVVGTPRDVQICNGQLVDSVADGGAVAVLAMYPRQPFDFAGRTGRIVFDVSNDTQGSHMAWPEVVVTDQPVPAPFEDAAGVADYARNSFGLSLASDCRNGAFVPNGEGDSWGVSTMFTTSNYAFSSQKYRATGCVKKSPGVNGPMNHVEIRISPSHVEVWATDPGDSNLKQLATADITMPLTRGLVWWEEAHYNANKEPGTQGDHSFAWDNMGFDGPILPRDLGFDILDADSSGTSAGELGYKVPGGRSLSLQIPNVNGVENAAAALLEFTWLPRVKASVTYSLNGNPSHTVEWPYGPKGFAYKSNTLAVPVDLSEISDGTNTISISTSDPGTVSFANFDLILVGAGGMPNGAPAPAAPAAPAPDTSTPPAPDTSAPPSPADDSSMAPTPTDGSAAPSLPQDTPPPDDSAPPPDDSAPAT